ncbi:MULTISPECIES: DNA polymerase III subunit beta [Legionella]|uniref:Beta sliding clamp n=1 Tax=Legionella septentrionalis TaxID=2498109 RepID=A0A433JLX5_9GAMM|nr:MULTISPECIES: DNA polymerase III subunit beta [Legionella]MCP0914833.1 DNA polymerase III subunit beta [Legionella sp. 27cVA30]RUQ91032.1 DNA polymerase III subunit beta [Legionella septentrionalis]RUR02898.1 DNA polymerase III subunit beta [Legionella septentrionalis]RUR11497.1 DNA polymerase III subunit beta [Legionella septentrionalis]RUR16762.1 DNA polymerase III subunit beta [Legionella septentrionalis]
MFELTISKQELLSPLLTVAGAVDKKQSLAVLANILIKLGEKELLLTGTDLEIEITARIPCKSKEAAGAITVPAKKMVDIIRSLEDNAQPIIACDAGVVTIKEGRSQFKLATLPADTYPNSEDEVGEVEFSLPRLKLIHLLQSTHFAMSQQDVRVFLNGLLLELDAQMITAVATDGHRMAICRLPCAAGNQHQRLLLPRKGVQEMLRLLNNITDEQISISVGKSHFKLITSQYTFLSKLIEARFPPYAKAIPREQDKQVIIERDLLKRALSRIIILAHEKSRAVLLHVQSSQLTLIANNQEQEEAIETLEAQTQGDELKIGINASYLLDVLNHINDGQLRLSMTNTESSILVEDLTDEHYQYVIMPMKI